MKLPEQTSLTPTVVKLGFVSLFADIASEMLYPITPIFLTTMLGASMTSLGFIEGLAEAIASLLKTYSGAWSDKISRRKPFILIGYLMGALAKPIIGFSTSWLHVLGARAFDRTGKGLRSAPRDALLADSVKPQNRGAAFGWHRAMDTLGAALGPLLAIYLLSIRPNDLREIFFWALIPGFISVLIVLSIQEASSGKKISYRLENPFKKWKQITNSAYKKYVLAWGLFSLTNSSDIFLLMKVKQSGGATTTVILIYCFYNLIYALVSPFLGKLSDQIDRRKVLSGGLLIFSLVYLGFGFANSTWQYWILFGIYGLYMGATDGVSKALAVDLSPAELKATGIGILGTVTGICTLFASVGAGLIWEHLGAFWTFAYGAMGAVLAALILIHSQYETVKVAS